MSPVVLGGIGLFLWSLPGLYVLWVWMRSRSEHRPDPVFEDEEVAYLEELWSMPARDHAS